MKKRMLLKMIIGAEVFFFGIAGGFAQDNKIADSLEQVLKSGKPTEADRALLFLKTAKAFLHSDDKKTFAYADTAISLATKNKDTKVQADALSLQGVVYKNRGEFKKAIEKDLLSLSIKEANQDTMGVAICYNDIGVLYKVMKNYTKALDYYKRANVLCRKIDLGKGIAQTYNNIGTIFSELGNKDSAIVYYKKALAKAEEIKNNAAISTACNNIGEYYGNQNMNEMALVYFKKCLAIDLKEGNVYGMILSSINIGGACTQTKKYTEALENYRQAEKLCVENEERPMLKDLYWSISQCYALSNDKAKAYDYLVKYKNLNETLQTEDINRNILEVETKYQSEKKDLEIAKNKAELKAQQEQARIRNIILFSIVTVVVLLTILAFIFYRNEQIRQKAKQATEIAAQKEIRARAIIEAEEKERIRIARDLHDGIGQLLSAAKLNLSSIETKIEIKGPEQQAAFKNAVDLLDESVKEVRAISHNMMPNVLIKLGLASAVREFITKIQNMPDLKVSLEIIGMKDRIEQEKESILYRVIQEIVSNIIKHAKASELGLQLIRHEKELTIIVEDNGVGFDTKGINEFGGIGLKNIISRVEFINGTVNFDSLSGRGTTVVVDVPIG